ncbi:MAG: hypothetical protein M3131_10785, partial [Actinomycetota bacterium]|nr:hypothetical protein [Actinomycetota bacterium]
TQLSDRDETEADPDPPVERPPSPAATQPPQVQRQLPTLSIASARRYAQSRIKRKHPRAKRMRVSCSRRTRTSAACKVRWSVGSRAAYAGRMVVSYRRRGGDVMLAASSRLRRIR